METASLELHLEVKNKERSKDSNSNIILLDIKDGLVVYLKEYFGFRANNKKGNFTKEINKEEEQKIIDFIKKNKLNINLDEKQETEGMGTSKELKLEISKPFQTKIQIIGKSHISGSNDYVKREWGKKYIKSRTNIEHIDIVNNAENILFFIKNIEMFDQLESLGINSNILK